MAAKTGKKAAPKEPKAEDKPKAAEAQAPPADAAFSLDADAGAKAKIVRAKGFKNVTQGIAHVCATFNNTQVSITDLKGNVIAWSSAGKCGFRGSKKSTAYVAQVVAQDACRQAMGHGLK